MRRLVLTGLAGAALVINSAAAWAEPPLWVVKGSKGQAVLFGSVHLLPPGLAWRPAALDRALARADTLWFELPIDQTTDRIGARLIAAKGLLPAGRRLSDLLTAEQGARLTRAATGLKVDPASLETLRPWMADLTLSLQQDSLAGARASQGVEQAIQNMAPGRLKRRALETPEQQVGFLADATVADQVASLNETLSEIIDQPELYHRVVDEWMAGDTEALSADALGPLRAVAPRLYERLIAGRNRRWARIIGARLRHKGVSVVVVGAGHLVGSDGLPALLRAQGLQVVGPLPSAAAPTVPITGQR